MVKNQYSIRPFSRTKHYSTIDFTYLRGDLVFLTRASTGVMPTLSYHLSSINYTYSQFAPTSLFASASTTNRVRRHRQSMPPPTAEYENDNVSCRCGPLC